MDHIFIKVDGQDLPAEAMNDLIEVTVDTSLHMPDMFIISLHDERLHWIDQGPFGLGKPVEIAAQPEGGGQRQPIFKGEITALEPDFGEGTMLTLVIRGYDRSHRLHRGTQSKAYQNVSDSDLASKIAQEVGLSAQVDATSEVYPHLIQRNQTHFDFLCERARRIGYECYVEDRALHFKRPGSNGNTLELEWGRQLQSFRPRLTLTEQVDEVSVKGWDPKAKQAIVGQASQGNAEPKIGERQSGAQLASSAFSNAKRAVVNRCVNSQAEADAMAQAVLDEISGAYIEAEGECYGTPELRAGKVIKLTSLGQRFSGEYFVTAARQVYRASGYRTQFSIHGRRPETLFSLIESKPEHANNQQFLAPTVGIVTNNKDPEERGRVKVKFPWLADDVESDWARIVSPDAGAERGFFWLPEVNDEVLVAFEHGDINHPYVLGGVWNGEDKPPLAPSEAVGSDGKVNQRIIQSRSGHLILLDDKQGAEKITIKDKTGNNEITIDSTANSLTIKIDQGGVSIESKGPVSVKSTSGDLTFEGMNISLKAQAQCTVEGTAGLTLKGAPPAQIAMSGSVNVNNGALEVT